MPLPLRFKRCTSDTGFSPPQGGFLFLPLLCGFLFSECAMQKTGVVVEAVKIAPAVSVTAITFLGCQISDWVSIVTLTYTLTLLGHFIWKKLVRPWWRKRRLQTGVRDALQEQIGARPRCGTATVAALASFVYHFGETKFARSTLLRRINAGEGAHAANSPAGFTAKTTPATAENAFSLAWSNAARSSGSYARRSHKPV